MIIYLTLHSHIKVRAFEGGTIYLLELMTCLPLSWGVTLGGKTLPLQRLTLKINILGLIELVFEFDYVH